MFGGVAAIAPLNEAATNSIGFFGPASVAGYAAELYRAMDGYGADINMQWVPAATLLPGSSYAGNHLMADWPGHFEPAPLACGPA